MADYGGINFTFDNVGGQSVREVTSKGIGQDEQDVFRIDKNQSWKIL